MPTGPAGRRAADTASIDSLTGARLEAGWERFRDPKWQEVLGDLTQRTTWKSLEENRAKRNIPAYDLILFRPVAGAEFLFKSSHPHDVSLGHYELNRLLNRTLPLLAPKGTLLIEQISEIHPVYMDILIRRLSDDPRYKVRLIRRSHQDGPGYPPVLRIDRTS